MRTTHWHTQQAAWPARGRHILAQHDEHHVVVYQAFRRDIADYAVTHQRLGGPWSAERMTWIKPNFLWMMYRCGWATKADQERVLAIWLDRSAFEEQILACAVPSQYDRDTYATREAWQHAVKRSDVRLQWDPDHGPSGAPLERRAIQLGLRGVATRAYAESWVREIQDVTDFVATQREHRGSRDLLLSSMRSSRGTDRRCAARCRTTWRRWSPQPRP
ncbi:MAG: DUF4291 domain-containing protein [Polyangiales bacterium]